MSPDELIGILKWVFLIVVAAVILILVLKKTGKNVKITTKKGDLETTDDSAPLTQNVSSIQSLPGLTKENIRSIQGPVLKWAHENPGNSIRTETKIGSDEYMLEINAPQLRDNSAYNVLSMDQYRKKTADRDSAVS